MPDTVQPKPIDYSTGHISIRIDGRPDVQFQFARQPKRTALALLASFTVQVGTLALILFAGRWGLEEIGVLPERPDMVFIANPGPGGGGGGGGNQMKEPPKKAEIPKPKAVEVTRLEEIKPDPTPTLKFDIPVTTLAQVEIPGALQAPAGLSTLSRGPGTGDGAGTGRGAGIGPGDGSGLGPGSGGNMGGGPKRPGNGVTDPVPTYSPLPAYTGEAMRARVQGVVWVECTVTKLGVCTDIHVVRSLDPKYGLDQEAIATAQKWRFKPGLFQGQPVDVIISIEIGFSLR